MRLLDILTQVDHVRAEDVRHLDIDPRGPLILDVRQPEEYAQGHIPGATLIPLSELPQRLDELDPAIPVITYCAAGVRSRSAAALLNSHGIAAATMDGGMNAWQGLVAHALPDQGRWLLESTESPEEVLALAATLEANTGKFYERLATAHQGTPEGALFHRLAAEEQRHHKLILAHLESPPDISLTALEGGRPPDKLIHSIPSHDMRAILEWSMAFETDALDLYLRMARLLPEEIASLLEELAGHEQKHLDDLAAFRGRLGA